MSLRIILMAGIILAGPGLFAQSANPKTLKQPTPKEGEAINAILQAQDPAERMAAADKLVTEFADTDYKALAMYIAAEAAEAKGDHAQVMIYGQRALEADPQNFGSMIIMARNIAGQTKEFDLDKEEKLTRAKKYADDALQLIPKATKLNPQLTDEQFTMVKNDFTAQARSALGMIGTARKDYDAAITEFKAASDVSPQKDVVIMARLADAYVGGGKFDEAIALCDEIAAQAEAPAAVKTYAAQTKAKAAAGKAQKK